MEILRNNRAARGIKRHAQSFDKDNIFTIKAGKKYNNYEAIQEAREDTEIYPTLEKYGCIDRLKTGAAEWEGYGNDLRGITNLRDIFEMQKEANELWLNLPLDVREEFGHSKENFVKNGNEYIKNKLKQFNDEQQQNAEKYKEANETKNEEKDNG